MSMIRLVHTILTQYLGATPLGMALFYKLKPICFEVRRHIQESDLKVTWSGDYKICRNGLWHFCLVYQNSSSFKLDRCYENRSPGARNSALKVKYMLTIKHSLYWPSARILLQAYTKPCINTYINLNHSTKHYYYLPQFNIVCDL